MPAAKKDLKELTYYPDTAENLGKQIQEASLDYEAFTQLTVPCQLARCQATCCYDGVYLGQEEVKGIQELLKREEKNDTWNTYGLHSANDSPLTPENTFIQPRPGKEKTATREAKEGELPPDFPAHFAHTRCVFLDSLGRCGLQRLAMEEGKHPWYYKPLTCWLHPISLEPARQQGSRPRLTLYNAENDPHKEEGYPGFCSVTPCGKIDATGIPAHQSLKEELDYLSTISGRAISREITATTL